MNLWQLFFLFFTTAAFTFGGGYVMIPILTAALVPAVLTTQDMANIVALAQMTPGAVGLNTATYVGFTQFGFLGACICTLGLISPGVIIGTGAAMARQAVQNSKSYAALLSGIRPAVIGLVATVVLFFADGSLFTAPVSALWTRQEPFALQWQGCLIFAVCLFLQHKFKLNVILLILIAGILGALFFQ